MPIEDKKQWLEVKCEERRNTRMNEFITLVVEREHIVRDSFYQFLTIDGFDFHKRFKIYFVGEQAQDEGGTMREWITELTNEMLSSSAGIFQPLKALDSLTYFPDPSSKDRYQNGEHLDRFRFAGSILAKALFEEIPVQAKLNLTVLKTLISPSRSNFQWEELTAYNDEIFKSVERLLVSTDLQDEDLQALSFTVQNANGDEIELCPGGKDLKINLKNLV